MANCPFPVRCSGLDGGYRTGAAFRRATPVQARIPQTENDPGPLTYTATDTREPSAIQAENGPPSRSGRPLATGRDGFAVLRRRRGTGRCPGDVSVAVAVARPVRLLGR